MAYYQITELISDNFDPSVGGTLIDIYKEVTGPLGLSYDDTVVLVREAVRSGYLRGVRTK